MDLKYLTTFRTIVEEGGFTAAAEKLNYTQSTITFQMDMLEKELSVQLFEKVGRRMQLTEAGRAFIPYANQVLESVSRLQDFRGQTDTSESELRIGAAETYLSYRLPEILGQVIAKVPKAKLKIRSMNCYEIRNALIEGTLDVGFFYQDIGGSMSSLTLIPIQTYPVVMVASPKVAAQIPSFTDDDRRYSVPLLINEKNCIFRQIFEQYLAAHRLSMSHTIELESIATIKKLVENDVGISFLPRFTVEQELNAGTLVEIPTGVEHNQITLVLGMHKNKWISSPMRALIDCVQTEGGQKPDA